MNPRMLAILAITALMSHAISAAPLVTLDAPSCGQWTVEIKKDSYIALAYGTWLSGYLSGAAKGSQIDILKNKPDKDGLMLWIGNYCQRNPLANVHEAANELIRELIKKNAQ